jgi:hypothetical protein
MLGNEQFLGEGCSTSVPRVDESGTLRIGSFLGEQLSINKRTHSYFLFPTSQQRVRSMLRERRRYCRCATTAFTIFV